MTNTKKRLIFSVLGVITSVLPPLFAVLSFFPLWKERGAETILSGISLCLILISAVPLFRYIKRILYSPSAPMLWFFVFILFIALSKIADDITVIAFIGFISNLIGTIFFTIAKKSGVTSDEKQI